MHSIIDTVQTLLDSLETASDEKKVATVKSLAALSKRLIGDISTMTEVTEKYQETILPALYAQLNAAEKRTEKAVDEILSACEDMVKAVKDENPNVKSAIQTHTNRIFETSAFQDLVSQHLNEIKIKIDDVGRNLGILQEIIKGDPDKISENIKKLQKSKGFDDHLLNGPSTKVD